MKALFVSKELNLTSGSGVGARMHRDTLTAILKSNNVYIVDLSFSGKQTNTPNYRTYGKYKSKLERIRRCFQKNQFFLSNEIIDDICNIISDNNIKFVFLDDSVFGKLATTIKKRYPKVVIVSFFHDVKASLYPIWMKSAKLWDKVDMMIGLKNEEISVCSVDKNIVLNLAENNLLYQYYGKKADYFLPVCVGEPAVCKKDPYIQQTVSGKKRILFVGALYQPNINGVHWFYKNVFTKISNEYDLWVVGKGLDTVEWKIQNDASFHVKGFVDSLADYYEYADVVIAPLTDGGGMKIKTAEAISYGKTFIGSSESLRGYYENMQENIRKKFVFQCDSAEEYINAFNYLSKNGIKRKNEELIQIYEENYSPSAAYNVMKKILEETTGVNI